MQKTQVPKRRKVGPRWKQNHKPSINIAQEDDSNIFELLQNLWINNLRFIIFKMFYILFICYFYFTFTVYTDVLNTAVFMVRKGKEKAI